MTKKIIVTEPDKSGMTSDKLDKIFGSKTRAKLLRLFYSEPVKTYYIRELSDLIGEQVNSIRRELDNMKYVGIVVEHNVANKIYYGLDKKFEHFEQFVQIFYKRAHKKFEHATQLEQSADMWERLLMPIRPMINAILLIRKRKTDDLDLFIIGDDIGGRLARWAKDLERKLDREINYVVMSARDFNYRMSVRDKFLISCLNNGYTVIVDDYGIVKTAEAKV